MKLHVILAMLVALLLAGCGKPAIDTSNEESLQASMEKVEKSLPKDRREEFREAVNTVAFGSLDMESIFEMAAMAETGEIERRMKDALDGKTADEVIRIAEEILGEREREAREGALKSLAEGERLEAKEEFQSAIWKYESAMDKGLNDEEIKERIAKVKQSQQRQEEEEQRQRELENKVQAKLREARDLLRNEKLTAALDAYEGVLILDGDSEEAVEGIEEVKKEIEAFQEKQTYLEQIDLYDFEASLIDTYSGDKVPAVRFKLKNNGDRSLEEVEVTVYFRDNNGNIISEETYYPIYTRRWSGNNKPLKPGYIWTQEKDKWYVKKDLPDEWDIGNAGAKITNFEFGDHSHPIGADLERQA